ncbi:MAG: hypothetical protein LBO70_00630 [Clostridiales Family XIII bacterium]|jgi:hypothetical protein|nr:hypothetical protein [Clostridiales Family XIII bacterium]
MIYKKTRASLIILCVITIAAFSSCTVFDSGAKDKIVTGATGVPEPMQPGTVIKFTDATTFEIMEGGFPTDSSIDVYAYTDAYFPPIAGNVVKYATDGDILDIEYPEGAYNPYMDPDASVGSDGGSKSTVRGY